MVICVEKHIPFLQGVLEPFAEVAYLAPEEFTPERVRNADALFIRTRTRCDAALLAGSKVRFIATATIGYDHIDRTWCEQNGIFWTSCPGCNSQAVCDYIEEALKHLFASVDYRSIIGRLMVDSAPVQHPYSIHSVGVVGVGHVGSKVCAMARRLGLDVVENDPPRGLYGDVTQCDVITFHTPLDDTTRHLCDEAFLSRLQPHAVIINAARGGVVDEQALLRSGHPYIIDCWENEPHLNPNVLLSPNCLLASYHVAGYSVEGKKNASQMCLDAFSHFFNLPTLKCQINSVPLHGDSEPGWLHRLTAQLQAHPDDFEQLRKEYPLR